MTSCRTFSYLVPMHVMRKYNAKPQGICIFFSNHIHGSPFTDSLIFHLWHRSLYFVFSTQRKSFHCVNQHGRNWLQFFFRLMEVMWMCGPKFVKISVSVQLLKNIRYIIQGGDSCFEFWRKNYYVDRDNQNISIFFLHVWTWK